MKKSRPASAVSIVACHNETHYTDDQTFHLILTQHLYTKLLLDVVVVLERAAARRHNTQLRLSRPIELLVFPLQLVHEIQTILNLVRVKLEKGESAAEFV